MSYAKTAIQELINEKQRELGFLRKQIAKCTPESPIERQLIGVAEEKQQTIDELEELIESL